MAVNLNRCILFVKITRSYTTLPAENLPVIKIPTYIKKYVEKEKLKREERRMAVLKKIVYRGDTSFPIISSNIKEYNFYRGQIYNKNYPIPLLSKYWRKGKSSDQKFTINPWDVNPSLPLDLQIPQEVIGVSGKDSMARIVTEFHHMDLSPVILEGIKALGYERPTPIQANVIPKFKEDKHLLCVSETGSGKTMAYLIPIIDNLRKCRNTQDRYPNTPLCLIISPGRELAEQIALSAYRLGELCGVSVKLAVPEGTKHMFLRPNNSEPFDILVATFGTIHMLAKKRVMNLSHVKHLVLDEADTLLDSSFLEEREKFFGRILVRDTVYDPEMKKFAAQVIFSSSTIPKNAFSMFDDFGMEDVMQRAVSPFVHRILPHIKQKFIRVNNENRLAHLLELVNHDVKKKIPVMIFCNKSNTCDFISYTLDENNVQHVRFHAGMSFEDRDAAFHRFQSGDVDVFCCTDLGSRGLDTQRVKHVINFDFPNNASDYILRVGRVGRVGTNHGHVTSLVVSKSATYVVQNIEMSIRMSTDVSGVDADVKKKLHKLYGK